MSIERINIHRKIGIEECIMLDFLFQNNAKAAELRNENFNSTYSEMAELIDIVKKAGAGQLDNMLSEKLIRLTRSNNLLLNTWISVQYITNEEKISKILAIQDEIYNKHYLSLNNREQRWISTIRNLL